MGAAVGQHVQRHRQSMLAFGMNGVAIARLKKNINALKKSGLAGRGRIYADETSEFWKSPASPRTR